MTAAPESGVRLLNVEVHRETLHLLTLVSDGGSELKTAPIDSYYLPPAATLSYEGCVRRRVLLVKAVGVWVVD